MQTAAESRHLSVPVECGAAEAYDFLSVPENFPQWASGLDGLRKVDGEWIVEMPDGPARIRFSERNAFGILDHWVLPAADAPIYIPLRVVPNGTGCELIFTLFRQPGMTDEKFSADAAWVMRDLWDAKKLLESP